MPDLTATPYGQETELSSGILTAFAGKGTVNGVSFLNRSGADVFLMFFDTDSQASLTVGSLPSVPVPSGEYYESTLKRGFAEGAIVGVSSAGDSFSEAPNADDCQIAVFFGR